MIIQDVSAIDLLIDFYGDYCKVIYFKNEYQLSNLKDYLIDMNINLSIDDHCVKANGIYNQNNDIIVEVISTMSQFKDDIKDI